MPPRVLQFTVYGKPEPQGSARAFVRAGHASITTDNKKLRPFRSEVTRMARADAFERELSEPVFAKGTSVRVDLYFRFLRPPSAKKRTHPVVKPDLDKLVRAILDSLTGVGFADDGQVVEIIARKIYDTVECADISVTEL
jgi:Holliday junction resolvase RusA-like endonuclease